MAKGYKTSTGKPTGGKSAVGASNPAQAAALNRHKTGQPTVPHNQAHGSKSK